MSLCLFVSIGRLAGMHSHRAHRAHTVTSAGMAAWTWEARSLQMWPDEKVSLQTPSSPSTAPGHQAVQLPPGDPWRVPGGLRRRTALETMPASGQSSSRPWTACSLVSSCDVRAEHCMLWPLGCGRDVKMPWSQQAVSDLASTACSLIAWQGVFRWVECPACTAQRSPPQLIGWWLE